MDAGEWLKSDSSFGTSESKDFRRVIVISATDS